MEYGIKSFVQKRNGRGEITQEGGEGGGKGSV